VAIEMLNKSKIALSLALVLGAASTATAATKHPVHRHNTAVVQPAPRAAYETYGSTGGAAPSREPTYIYIQDHDNQDSYAYGG